MDDTLQSSTNIFETLQSDHADFEEIKLSLNLEEFEYEMTTQVEASGNSMYLDPEFYDVQKLILNERGEDKYTKEKKRQLQN